MSVEYGRRGLVGVLTPQANTTVEPEMAILLPPGVASINARMVSRAPDMQARLNEYFDRLGEWPAQFANAPVDVVAAACTGASYLVGAEREQALVQAVSARIGKPVVTSGLAVVAALRALEARRVALVSPYPRALTEVSVAYWGAFGIKAVQVVEVGAPDSAFHPIYAMPAADARAALDGLEEADGLDAVVMLGDGDANAAGDPRQATGRRRPRAVLHAGNGLALRPGDHRRAADPRQPAGLDRPARMGGPAKPPDRRQRPRPGVTSVCGLAPPAGRNAG